MRLILSFDFAHTHTHTSISTQLCMCKYTCTRSYVHAQSSGGFTFPGMPTILILLYSEVNKRACSQALLPIAVAILLSCRVKIWESWEFDSTVLQIYTKEASQKLFCKTTSAFLIQVNLMNSFKCCCSEEKYNIIGTFFKLGTALFELFETTIQ